MAAKRSSKQKRDQRDKARERKRTAGRANLSVVEGRTTHFRRRHRKPSADRKTAIVNRVIRNFDEAVSDRTESLERRQQLYAKFRGWVGGDPEFPWPGASDVDIPDMRTAAMEVQDALHNAVLSGRPSVTSEALDPADEPKTKHIDNLIDFQLFREAMGETMIGDAAEAFTVEGHVTIFTPWVREKARLSVQADFPPVPPDTAPSTYFTKLVRDHFPAEFENWASPQGKDKRVWRLAKRPDQADEWTLRFYDTLKDREDGTSVAGIEYYGERHEVVFDGPVPRVIPWERVVCPSNAGNLQPQSLSNPKGALWVALVDYPTKVEIERLQKSGVYDLLSDDDMEGLFSSPSSRQNRQMEDQEHAMQGTQPGAHTPDDERHQELTRLMVFDDHDMDDDGRVEGVIYTVLLEPRLLCSATPLTERYRVPEGGKPWRPLADGPFLPARGRREGMGLPDMMEGLHDAKKELFDTGVNTDVMATLVTGAYRPQSNMPLETLSLTHGDLIPLQNPREDLVFRPTPSSSSAFGFNAISLLTSWEEKMTLLGDLQRGRVPAGKATALRTSSGIDSILEQGEARPERILRRFFAPIVQVWEHVHWLNLMHLSDAKRILVAGLQEPGEAPYTQVGRADIQGVFKFGFGANASNASRSAKADLLFNQLNMALNPVLLQVGISTPDTLFRLVRDWADQSGAPTDIYWAQPTPTADLDPISAEEVLMGLVQNPPVPPMNRSPAEGARAHFEKINSLIEAPIIELEGGGKATFMQLAEPGAVAVLRAYLEGLEQQIQAEGQEEQLAAAAAGQTPAALPAGASAAPGDNTQAALQDNELADETLPSNNREGLL